MTNYIVHEQKERSNLAITHIAPAMFNTNSIDRIRLREKGIDFKDDDEIIEWVKNKDIPRNVKYLIVKQSDFPSHPDFSYAWEIKENRLTLNMDKARIIHMDNLRILRKQKFNELGFPDRLHPEIEKGLLSDETKNKLKALRDIPQTFDLSKAKTINELKVLIPEILLNNSK